MFSADDLTERRQHIELTLLRLRNRERELQDDLDATNAAIHQATGALILLNELQKRMTESAPSEGDTDG
jgi:chaperonin cofactor prefoldin